MKKFSSINDLLQEIKLDAKNCEGSSGRYFIRVIFLDNFVTFKDLLFSINLLKIDLSDLLSAHDKWFTYDKLLNIIQTNKETAIIYPLSEIIRFYSNEKIQSFLTSLFESQNDKDNLTKRIYIPLVGLYEKFTDQFWGKFHRQKEGAPVWRIQTNSGFSKITIYKLNTEIKTNIKLISNNKEWLDYWKSDIKTPVINTSSSLNRRWNNFLSDDCFESKILNNIADFLKEIYSLEINYNYEDYEKKFWEEFLELYEQERKENTLNFYQFIHHRLNINNITIMPVSEILLLYLNSEKFEKWLIKLYYFSERISDDYLKKIISKCHEYSNTEMIRKLFFLIFELDPKRDDYFHQRNDLINSVYSKYTNIIDGITVKLLEKLSSYELHDSLKYISGHTIEEQKYLVNSIQQLDESKKEKILKNKLVHIKNYLDWNPIRNSDFISIDSWIIEYFTVYDRTKFNNFTSDKYESLFNTLNENSDTFFKWYYSIKELPEISDGIVIQVDALGVEWLAYIFHIINQFGKDSNKEITSVSIHRSYLPTVTKFNKIKDVKYIQDLDLLLHDKKGYKFPDTLIMQLQLVREILMNILQFPDNKIYLTSDHGSTCHCLKQFGRIKKYDFENDEHEGRYIKDSVDIRDNNNFVRTNGYYIGLKHDSLNDLPRREVHGGATPEEVLIPLITIEKIKKKIEYRFEFVSKIIKYNSKKIKLKIYPVPQKFPVVIVNEIEFYPDREKNYFIFNISVLSSGSYKGKCIIEDQELPLKFEILGGLKEEELF